MENPTMDVMDSKSNVCACLKLTVLNEELAGN